MWERERRRVYTYRYTVTIRMTCIKMGGDESRFNVPLVVRDSHKTVSRDHNFWRERRAEAVSNRGPSAYQPTALPLGQTGSLNCTPASTRPFVPRPLHEPHFSFPIYPVQPGQFTQLHVHCTPASSEPPPHHHHHPAQLFHPPGPALVTSHVCEHTHTHTHTHDHTPTDCVKKVVLTRVHWRPWL